MSRRQILTSKDGPRAERLIFLQRLCYVCRCCIYLGFFVNINAIITNIINYNYAIWPENIHVLEAMIKDKFILWVYMLYSGLMSLICVHLASHSLEYICTWQM